MTDLAESACAAVFINQQDDSVYVAYVKGGTWGSAVDAVFKKSSDGMANWAAESSYSEGAADDIRMVHAGRTVGASGGRYQPVFFNDDLNDIFVNLTYDVEIAAAAGGGNPAAAYHYLSMMRRR